MAILETDRGRARLARETAHVRPGIGLRGASIFLPGQAVRRFSRLTARNRPGLCGTGSPFHSPVALVFLEPFAVLFIPSPGNRRRQSGPPFGGLVPSQRWLWAGNLFPHVLRRSSFQKIRRPTPTFPFRTSRENLDLSPFAPLCGHRRRAGFPFLHPGKNRLRCHGDGFATGEGRSLRDTLLNFPRQINLATFIFRQSHGCARRSRMLDFPGWPG